VNNEAGVIPSAISDKMVGKIINELPIFGTVFGTAQRFI
jgi:hypothetical protein